MVLTGNYHLSDGVTATAITRTYTNMKQLAQAAHSVLQTLQENDCDGNQWILVLELTNEAIERLNNDKECLGGVVFRFEWEGATGLIKIIPGAAHESLLNDFSSKVGSDLQSMDINWSDRRWIGAATYKGANKGKQGDQAFTPPSRLVTQGQTRGWPTLVVEVGGSESKTKLHSDAKFWFNNSNGQTRFVILISVKRARVTFEKWMLMPPNAPNPAPLQNQPAANQQLYSAQEVVVTPTGVTGAPMILPFRALYDRAPGPNESDITITAQDFRDLVRTIF
ncbi:hypothetical protein CNMCM5793_001742 [Aspergillus hiratsukae]|uniref:Uncharacterized protein n=1 Tax=Aspergillus hiratsukae TaxID=1194566 RepID=A0A8H6PBJ3_9EURO|nr:hypothetical protein CNMCM5793_001742 [Aspergillus hiratsukae]KAF7165237.1 hypothetical protein CNMCM6106_001434 [Aspergillus hiratsukae]